MKRYIFEVPIKDTNKSPTGNIPWYGKVIANNLRAARALLRKIMGNVRALPPKTKVYSI